MTSEKTIIPMNILLKYVDRIYIIIARSGISTRFK